jgi:hypothetical protein
MRFALLTCLAALLVTSVVIPRVCVAALVLNEILQAPGSDWDGDGAADSRKDEWVEITNSGTSVHDLSGCLILSGDDRAPVYGFSGSIAPGGHQVVYGRDALAWESDNGCSAIGLSLNNGGDVAYLARVATGDTLILDSLRYGSGDVGYDVSMGRVPDGTGAWTLFDHFDPTGGNGLDPTPGRFNSSDPAPHIIELGRDPLFPTAADSAHIVVEAGDASGVVQVLLAYDINLEDGEEYPMEFVSGSQDMGTWLYTIPPCAYGDTVHYRVSVFDPQSSTASAWMGYRVRSQDVSVKLNEILADPPADLAGDANRDGVRDASDDEFVELVNCGTEPVDISGWQLRDGTSARHVFAESGVILQPGEFATVFGGGTPTGFKGKVFTASSGGLGLANTGDLVSLLDSQAALVDVHAYGSEGGSDQAMVRLPDCSDLWGLPADAGLDAPFSPHAPNQGDSSVDTSSWGSIKALYRR